MLICLFPCLPASSSSVVDGKAARLNGTQQQVHSTLPANPTPPLVWPLLGWHCQRQGDVPVSWQCKWPRLLEMSSPPCMSTVWPSGLESTLPFAMPQDIRNYYLMQPHITICSFYTAPAAKRHRHDLAPTDAMTRWHCKMPLQPENYTPLPPHPAPLILPPHHTAYSILPITCQVEKKGREAGMWGGVVQGRWDRGGPKPLFSLFHVFITIPLLSLPVPPSLPTLSTLALSDTWTPSPSRLASPSLRSW
jgi:hypothetical protein